jgi:hypothetical protein
MNGRSRSWLSASKLQENVKKAVNTPFIRSKSLGAPFLKPDPTQKESQCDGRNESASLSFTAITESLSASSEDLSEALGKKFGQLLHSTLSSSADSSLQSAAQRESLPSVSFDERSKEGHLWSALFKQPIESKDDDDTATTRNSSSSRSQGTAEIFGQLLASVTSSSSFPISTESQNGGVLSLLDGSTTDEEDDGEANLALFDEDCNSSCSSAASSVEDEGSMFSSQDDIDHIFGTAFNSILSRVDQCGIFGFKDEGDVNVDTQSVSSEGYPDAAQSVRQTRGRSRSPRPFPPFGLELEPSNIDEEDGAGFDGQNLLESTSNLQTENAGGSMNILQTMFRCLVVPPATFRGNSRNV